MFFIRNDMLPSRTYLMVRRSFDIVLAIIGILMSIPLIVLFSLLIRLDSRGSIFYRQERVGMQGRYFELLKLRTMEMDAEKEGPRWAGINDPRVTRIGRFLRKTRMDELPQLINVLKGDMSIIGPRPERPVFTDLFNEKTPGFINRLAIKPGLTGWAQVNGGYEMSPEEKLAYDLDYIRNRSFTFDLKILFLTVKVIMTGEGAR
ncbi:exopolysaccharide biosynthesis polyprenyl glycosylphosphotransferase [Rossellomorea vietnamensis]|uniref:sugar transferase n=1 Tax=Rossellomorea vietnamensis TaxID=218284 RepID=UPI001CCC55B7|nr:sugar transferase [Rossellomorea vietnamensis]MCA0149779.1 exopolysaccharide biosynthesis polyprenyl glycosylphosphotransferase [Rossellomorea vietnamensis]